MSCTGVEFVPCIVCAKVFFLVMAVLFAPVVAFGYAYLLSVNGQEVTKLGMVLTVLFSGPLGWLICWFSREEFFVAQSSKAVVAAGAN